MSRAQVCQGMCDLVGMPGLWTVGNARVEEDGPTELAVSFAERPQGRLAGPQLVIFEMAWAVWCTGTFAHPGADERVQEGKQAMLAEMVAESEALVAQLAADSAG